MGFLSGALSPLITATTQAVGGAQQGRNQGLLEKMKLDRQNKNDEIVNALHKAQTTRALREPPGHLTWKMSADGEYVGLPTDNPSAATHDAPPATAPSDAPETPAAHATQSTPNLGVKSGVKAPPKAPPRIDPNSPAGISADSTKAVNRAQVRQKYPAPSKAGAKESPDDKAYRVFIAQRMKSYMSPQYDSASSGILKSPPLSREQAVQKAQADAQALFPNHGGGTQAVADPTAGMSDADAWEYHVKHGMTKQAATAAVSKRHKQ